MSRVARQGSTWVTSSCLCKYGEGAGFPFQVEALEDGVNDAIHAFDIHKTHHGPGSPAHLHEASLDDVGSSTVRFDSSYCPVPEKLDDERRRTIIIRHLEVGSPASEKQWFESQSDLTVAPAGMVCPLQASECML
jgi:hypothetical protein